MAYKKSDDLMELAIWMQANREGVSLEDIMNKYKVSRRTAERMRDNIVDNYHFMVEERKGDDNKKRWYIPQGTLKVLIGFTANDFACLEVAKKALQKAKMDDKANELDSIINKISACIKDNVYQKIDTDAEALLRGEGFAVRPGPKLIVDNDIIEQLRFAVLCNYQVDVEYYAKMSGKTNTYTLNPYGFIYGDRNHYLLAAHSNGYRNGEPHYFILSNIKSIKVTDDIFEVVENFSLQEYANRSFGAFQEEPFDVEWVFSANVADEAERMIFHPTQTMKRNDDGTLTVCFHAGGRIEMDWHLYTWGDDVKVIKPENWYGK